MVDGELIYRSSSVDEFFDFAKSAFKHLDVSYPKFYKMDRLCKLGFLAAEYLFAYSTGCKPCHDTAIILGNSSGSLDSDIRHYDHIKDVRDYQPSPSVFVYTLPNIVIGEIAIRHGIKGENAFFICEDPDDDTMNNYTEMLISQKITSSSLFGWVDYTREKYLAKLYWCAKTENI